MSFMPYQVYLVVPPQIIRFCQFRMVKVVFKYTQLPLSMVCRGVPIWRLSGRILAIKVPNFVSIQASSSIWPTTVAVSAL